MRGSSVCTCGYETKKHGLHERTRAPPTVLLVPHKQIETESESHLIHDKRAALLEIGDALIRQVQHATGRSHEDVHYVVETHDIVLEGRSPRRDLRINSFVRVHEKKYITITLNDAQSATRFETTSKFAFEADGATSHHVSTELAL